MGRSRACLERIIKEKIGAKGKTKVEGTFLELHSHHTVAKAPKMDQNEVALHIAGVSVRETPCHKTRQQHLIKLTDLLIISIK